MTDAVLGGGEGLSRAEGHQPALRVLRAGRPLRPQAEALRR